ncbi:MAG: basic amino acid ABC transporter substrate-binding protein [Armatimonadota bacterium]|nr:basic amino acid ABC transporter substrate-binding protein [Armatimonadota bacterium]MDR7448767.1 basic amino acid ABC transporter substrate-binding protein [Armatimonadota bacterium]MDR7459238.1 basic amino acid ABC transporter substrate-binding protein [Armatimonadota bacterium]MDR7479661.1 basic amino acid ABC transporter substrate-binding protein [Armatimonadota bacterium]MDR7487798.1 basic amino acid ABC transporter substrate-binding protein [Armatimonadota bacterium]
MRRTPRGIVLVALLVAVLVAAGCQRQAQQAPPGQASPAAGQVPDLGGRTLRVATDATYPPFEMLDPNKNIIGFDVDLITEICKLANCKPQIQSVAWEGVLAGVQKGDFDVAISGITITAERDKTVDFTQPYIEVGQQVLVRQDETRIRGAEDLADKTVAVQIGTTNDELATQMQKEGKVKEVKRYRTFDLAVQALLNRDVDAVIIDSVAALGYMGTNPGKLKTVGEKLTRDQLGIVVREGNTELRNAFNAALDQLKANGTLAQLQKKWFEEWKPTQ